MFTGEILLSLYLHSVIRITPSMSFFDQFLAKERENPSAAPTFCTTPDLLDTHPAPTTSPYLSSLRKYCTGTQPPPETLGIDAPVLLLLLLLLP